MSHEENDFLKAALRNLNAGTSITQLRTWKKRTFFSNQNVWLDLLAHNFSTERYAKQSSILKVS